MTTGIWHEGERLRIVRIAQPDQDSFAVIHLEGGFAFPCSKAWVDGQEPRVGDYVVVRDGQRIIDET